ncbi:MAG: hypothetical protein PHE83_11265 [Opitutaceae bacterium]|nr:hypothetical protein [Opitutaceae bacterium]
MPDHRSNSPSRVTLEDLLRLKRAERPPVEFWVEFERDLQQKQLAALVEKKTWWHELAACYSRYGRVRVPLGATAIMALTLVSIRYYSHSGQDPRLLIGTEPVNQPAARVAVQPHDQARPVVAAAPVGERASVEQAPASKGENATPRTAAIFQALAGEVPGFIPWVDDVMRNRAGASELSPSARSIAVNLVTASVVEPDLVETLARPHGFEERAVPSVRPQHTAEVLPTATAAAEPRRARLLAALGSAGAYAPEPAAPEHARRSVSRYLAQDGWDRSMSRLEAEGDRLSIKF